PLRLRLGESSEIGLPAPERQALVPSLLRAYRNDPDPGLHAALDWLLRRWGQEAARKKIDEELATGDLPTRSSWYVNRQGQTFSLIRGPVEFWMGSPNQEPERYLDE